MSGMEEVCLGQLRYKNKEKDNICAVCHINSIISFKGNDLKLLLCGEWFLSKNTDVKATEATAEDRHLSVLLAFVGG